MELRDDPGTSGSQGTGGITSEWSRRKVRAIMSLPCAAHSQRSAVWEIQCHQRPWNDPCEFNSSSMTGWNSFRSYR
jgi:hypothetical protein